MKILWLSDKIHEKSSQSMFGNVSEKVIETVRKSHVLLIENVNFRTIPSLYFEFPRAPLTTLHLAP